MPRLFSLLTLPSRATNNVSLPSIAQVDTDQYRASKKLVLPVAKWTINAPPKTMIKNKNIVATAVTVSLDSDKHRLHDLREFASAPAPQATDLLDGSSSRAIDANCSKGKATTTSSCPASPTRAAAPEEVEFSDNRTLASYLRSSELKKLIAAQTSSPMLTQTYAIVTTFVAVVAGTRSGAPTVDTTIVPKYKASRKDQPARGQYTAGATKTQSTRTMPGSSNFQSHEHLRRTSSAELSNSPTSMLPSRS
mmetsp:Transcript_64133/g.165607  ORF Transcript_64133/g.165607 Transcript_64133/m.165607 type:complete len:250 (+) Transcript_64133:1501-2250(+)